jgi:hypothetical protein
MYPKAGLYLMEPCRASMPDHGPLMFVTNHPRHDPSRDDRAQKVILPNSSTWALMAVSVGRRSMLLAP